MPPKVKAKDEEIESAPEIEEAPAPIAAKAAKKDAALIAYAEFEYGGKVYGAGDVFAPPSELEYDKAFTEFRNANRKKGATQGLAFTKPGEIIDRKTGERSRFTFVLPVKPKE